MQGIRIDMSCRFEDFAYDLHRHSCNWIRVSNAVYGVCLPEEGVEFFLQSKQAVIGRHWESLGAMRLNNWFKCHTILTLVSSGGLWSSWFTAICTRISHIFAFVYFNIWWAPSMSNSDPWFITAVFVICDWAVKFRLGGAVQEISKFNNMILDLSLQYLHRVQAQKYQNTKAPLPPNCDTHTTYYTPAMLPQPSNASLSPQPVPCTQSNKHNTVPSSLGFLSMVLGLASVLQFLFPPPFPPPFLMPVTLACHQPVSISLT